MRILFLHFWGKGPTEALARGIQGALKTQNAAGELPPAPRVHARKRVRANYVAKFLVHIDWDEVSRRYRAVDRK